jgi:hypothetical protein
MPADITYDKIATTTLSASTSSITFSNIPNTYTDLVVITNTKLNSGITALDFRFNGDTASNYSYTRMYANDLNAVSTDRESNLTGMRIGFTSSTDYVNGIFEINNYKNTVSNKTVLGRSGVNDYGGYVFFYTGLWRSTSAINSVTIYSDNSTNFVSGSNFTIYGISAA